jgi:hypothetical protein
MKILSKLSIPFFTSTILFLNSYGQDYIPNKFRNYQDLNLKPSYSKLLPLDKDKYFRADYFDLDNDSLFDVVELTPLKVVEGKVVKAHFPYAYFFDFKNDFNLKCFIDSKMDGLNGNEFFLDSPDKYNSILEQKL